MPSPPIFSNDVITDILSLIAFKAICDMYGIEDMEKYENIQTK